MLTLAHFTVRAAMIAFGAFALYTAGGEITKTLDDVAASISIGPSDDWGVGTPR